jgi:formylglycine-generating enzyme required for sulfatase activity
MHGNVWEWCQDWWSDNLPGGIAVDPQGPSTGSYRVFRGGSWRDWDFNGFAWNCRSAGRYGHDPDAGGNGIGFRVVLAPGKP